TNATQLGGVAASQYVLTNDSRLTNSRPPAAGSLNYIQNTNTPQVANFNISGSGTAGNTLSAVFVNAVTQFDLANKRLITADASRNTIGWDAGSSNQGVNNSFFGNQAGQANTGGSNNA